MNCPRCGKQLKEGAKFCGECGLQMNEIPMMNQALQMNQMPVMNQAPQMNQMPVMNQAPQMNQMPVMNQAPQMNQMPMMNQAPQMNQIPQQKKSSNTILIIILSCVAALLLIAIIAVLVWRNSNDDEYKLTNSGNVSQENDDESKPEETVEESTPDTSDVAETVPETTPAAESIEHTIMVYMVGSNLEHNGGLGSLDIEEMVFADYGEDTRIVIQTGGCSDWYIEGMTDGQVERWEVCDGELVRLDTLGEMSMLTVDALSDFIEFAAEGYPAEKYSLVLWDHGGGVPISYGCDDMFPYDQLYDYQIGEALAQAGVSFECVIFTACNMCTLEVAMSIKDYAKYMVAAESTMLGNSQEGSGVDYDVWLNYLGTEDVTLLESYELLVTSYMDTLDSMGAAGSISLIDLRKIQDVYDAYVAYIASVHEDILNGGYEEYALARGNCGLYEYTESVDIITLATTYPTDASTELMNATVNAVCYTESDYAFGHGLAAYNPSEYIHYYGYARENMEELGYGTDILSFYDDVVSIGLSYMGTEYVDAYAGDWFNEQLAYGEAGEDYEPGTYTLDVTQMDGYQAITVSQDSWSIISSVEESVFIMPDDETAYLLGADNMYTIDANGYIVVEKPQAWTFVNGNAACYIATDYWEDASTGEWSQSGAIYATCNGETILMLVYYDAEHPQGVIQGYCLYDFWTGEGAEQFMQFAEDDVVEIILPTLYINSDDTLEEASVNLSGNAYYASDLVLEFDYINLEDVTVAVQYEITDVYENEYSTEWIPFE
ncbi:MAG: zinc-ribbon domain-containing protein [Lachnospiraceae bacterium]|nr:zinc-ribbon domain-containing protein [Lachnospiraceae bacterium]